MSSFVVRRRNQGTPSKLTVINEDGDILGEAVAIGKNRTTFHQKLSKLDMFNKGFKYIKKEERGTDDNFSLSNLQRHTSGEHQI
jgi:hypothetical protein